MSIRVPQKSLKIMGKGRQGRLSPDLRQIADSFSYSVDREQKKLVLDGKVRLTGADRLKVWEGRRDKSKSGMISLVSAIKGLGLNPEEVDGKVYAVNVEGKKLEVQF